jgi:hypothetical protein
MNDNRLNPEEVQTIERTAASIYPPPAWTSIAAVVLLVIGIVGFTAALKISPGRAWGAFLANFLFWTGLAAGALAVVATFNIAGSWWGRMVQRLLTPLMGFLPFSLIGLLILWFGKDTIYQWVGWADRPAWLANPSTVFIRDAIIILAMAIIGLWILYREFRVDLGAMGQANRVGSKGFTAFVTRGWKGNEREQMTTQRFIRNISPIIIFLYALGMSAISFDLEMSVQRHWQSSMFPGIYWLGQFYAAFAATTILFALWRLRAPVDEVISEHNLMDLGNMMWGACIFWGYVNWAQYFVLWMGNIPHEAAWHILRWRVAPWESLAFIMLACVFIAPFLLLFNRLLKRRAVPLAAVGVLAFVGVLLQRFLYVMPSVAHLGPTDYGLAEVTVTLGFLGAVALPYLWIVRRVPLFPIEDPLWLKSLATRGVKV